MSRWETTKVAESQGAFRQGETDNVSNNWRNGVRFPTLLKCSSMKKTKTGYKEMLRDRVPYIVDLALKWCKAKQLWINHTYNAFIGIYIDSDERMGATKTVLGIRGKQHNFNFHDSIDWDNLDDDETERWKNVENWVTWFQTNYLIFEQQAKLTFSTDYDIVRNAIVNSLEETQNPENSKLVDYITKTLI